MTDDYQIRKDIEKLLHLVYSKVEEITTSTQSKLDELRTYVVDTFTTNEVFEEQNNQTQASITNIEDNLIGSDDTVSGSLKKRCKDLEDEVIGKENIGWVRVDDGTNSNFHLHATGNFGRIYLHLQSSITVSDSSQDILTIPSAYSRYFPALNTAHADYSGILYEVTSKGVVRCKTYRSSFSTTPEVTITWSR